MSELNNYQNGTSDERKKNVNTRLPWIIAGIAILIAASTFVWLKSPANNQTVATINGEKVKKEEFYQLMAKQAGDSVLEQLIMEKLVAQEAKKNNISVSTADLDKEITEIKKEFPSDTEFNAALQQAGFTLDSLKAQLLPEVQIRKLIEPQIDTTDEKLKAYFETNKDRFAIPEQVQTSHILVNTQEEADAILVQLKTGDFATIAKEKSIDTMSKTAGGDLGFVSRGETDPSFEQAAFALQKGETSGVVRTESGYHIIKAGDKKAAVPATFEGAKGDVRTRYLDEELQVKKSTWLNDLMNNAKIEKTSFGAQSS